MAVALVVSTTALADRIIVEASPTDTRLNPRAWEPHLVRTRNDNGSVLATEPLVPTPRPRGGWIMRLTQTEVHTVRRGAAPPAWSPMGPQSEGWGQPRSRSAAFSPMTSAAGLVLTETMVGMMDASATRSPSMPCTRSEGSTTASSSVPIRQVPTGW